MKDQDDRKDERVGDEGAEEQDIRKNEPVTVPVTMPYTFKDESARK